jgi:ATP-dependent exoDNAse (exonuclease V) alpha subunit
MVVGDTADEQGLAQLYVAMTRARVTLTVIDPNEDVKRLQLENL